MQAGGEVRRKQDGELNRVGSFTDSGADNWTAIVASGDGKAPRVLILRGPRFRPPARAPPSRHVPGRRHRYG